MFIGDCQRKNNKEIEFKCRNEVPREALCALKSREEKYSTSERKTKKVRQGCLRHSLVFEQRSFFIPRNFVAAHAMPNSNDDASCERE